MWNSEQGPYSCGVRMAVNLRNIKTFYFYHCIIIFARKFTLSLGHSRAPAGRQGAKTPPGRTLLKIKKERPCVIFTPGRSQNNIIIIFWLEWGQACSLYSAQSTFWGKKWYFQTERRSAENFRPKARGRHERLQNSWQQHFSDSHKWWHHERVLT